MSVKENVKRIEWLLVIAMSDEKKSVRSEAHTLIDYTANTFDWPAFSDHAFPASVTPLRSSMTSKRTRL